MEPDLFTFASYESTGNALGLMLNRSACTLANAKQLRPKNVSNSTQGQSQ